MSSPVDTHIELQVSEASPRDAGRGLARLSKPDLERLGVRAGGVLEVHGQRKTAVRVLPARLEDRDKGILLDGFTVLIIGERHAKSDHQCRPCGRRRLLL